MSKPSFIGLALLLLVLGLMRVVMTRAAEPAAAQETLQTETDVDGPFMGLKPDDVMKNYQEMLKDAEEQKKADELAAQKKKSTSATKNQNGSTPASPSQTTPQATTQTPAQPATQTPTQPATQTPTNSPSQTTEPESTPATPPSEPSKSEPEDFIRGY